MPLIMPVTYKKRMNAVYIASSICFNKFELHLRLKNAFHSSLKIKIIINIGFERISAAIFKWPIAATRGLGQLVSRQIWIPHTQIRLKPENHVIAQFCTTPLKIDPCYLYYTVRGWNPLDIKPLLDW